MKPLIHLSYAAPIATFTMVLNILLITGSYTAAPIIGLIMTPVFGFFAQQSIMGMIYHFGNGRQ